MRPSRAAEEAVGPDFELESFHDAVPAHGSIPLPVLERVVREWVQAQKPQTVDGRVTRASANRDP